MKIINQKYENILSRINKKSSIEEGFYIIIRLYLTDNIFYYFLCVLNRFIPLIILSGDYINKFMNNLSANNSISFQQFFKNITIHGLLRQFYISFRIYKIICILIYILFLIKIFNYFYLLIAIKNKKLTKKEYLPQNIKLLLIMYCS